MLGLVSQEDHVRDPFRYVVEVSNHPIDILQSPTLLLLIGW
jgi:hypothetical protein